MSPTVVAWIIVTIIGFFINPILGFIALLAGFFIPDNG